MNQIKKFIDKTSNCEARQATTVVLTIEEARVLRDELSKLLIDLHTKEKEIKEPVFDVLVTGGKFK